MGGAPLYLHKSYERYSGFVQFRPLSPDEQKYDDTCRAIDGLERKIGAKPMGLFTAAEYGWFNWFVNKMFFFPKQPQLDKQVAELMDLLATLEAREAGANSPPGE